MASRKFSFNLRFSIVAVVLFAIVVLLNAVLGTVDLGRFDLTDDNVYTISPAAKRVLSELKVPVQVKFYVTRRDQMPTGLQTLERDVVDKLSEFAVVSGGNLDFVVVDPTDDDELQEKIAAKGIRPFQVQSIEKDAMGIKLVYSALEISYLDKEPEILPQILPQSLQTFEYDVCSAIAKLTRDMDPVVAVYSTRRSLDPQMMQLYLQMGQTPPEPEEVFGNVSELLRGQNYDVRRTEITKDSPIPEDAATLVVLSPKSLDERQRYEINRFVQRGGNLIVAVQRYEYQYSPSRQGGFTFTAQPIQTDIGEILDPWGLKISDKLFMDENQEVLAIPSERRLGGLRVQVSEPVKAPFQIKVTADQFNDEVSMANGVGQLLYLWGSRLVLDQEKLDDAGIEATTLFTSSPRVWEVEYSPGPLPTSALIPHPDSELDREPFGVLLRGNFPNLFAEGDRPLWAAEAGDSTATTEPVETFSESVPANVVVFGCSKLFEDAFLTMVPGNGTLLLNAVDALTLGDDLIQIRAKATAERFIEPVSDGAKLFWRFFTIGLVPLLAAGYGLFRHLRRRREEAAFLAAQGGR